jgi:hypothetical protein
MEHAPPAAAAYHYPRASRGGARQRDCSYRVEHRLRDDLSQAGKLPSASRQKLPKEGGQARFNEPSRLPNSRLQASQRQGKGVGVDRMTEQPDLNTVKEWSKQTDVT